MNSLQNATPLLAATASATPKQLDRNQDRAATFAVRDAATRRGVVVADGVGEFEASGIVASQAVEHAVAQLSLGGSIRDEALLLSLPATATRRWTDPVLGLADHVNQKLRDDPAPEGATTLVAMVASTVSRWAVFSLAGNGAVLEFGCVPLPGGSLRVLWIEHALPGVSFDRGRETLRTYLPHVGDEPLPVAQGSLRIPRREARLLIACSDGITSPETRRVGVNADGSTWLEVPGPLAILTRALSTSWPDLTAPDATDVDLAAFLHRCLDEALTCGTLDDDATLGALLVRAEQPGAAP